ATKPPVKSGAALRVAVFFAAAGVARSSQTAGGYARRSRLGSGEKSWQRMYRKFFVTVLFPSAPSLHPEHVQVVFAEPVPVVYQVQIFSRIQFRHGARLAPFPYF